MQTFSYTISDGMLYSLEEVPNTVQEVMEFFTTNKVKRKQPVHVIFCNHMRPFRYDVGNRSGRLFYRASDRHDRLVRKVRQPFFKEIKDGGNGGSKTRGRVSMVLFLQNLEAIKGKNVKSLNYRVVMRKNHELKIEGKYKESHIILHGRRNERNRFLGK